MVNLDTSLWNTIVQTLDLLKSKGHLDYVNKKNTLKCKAYLDCVNKNKTLVKSWAQFPHGKDDGAMFGYIWDFFRSPIWVVQVIMEHCIHKTMKSMSNR